MSFESLPTDEVLPALFTAMGDVILELEADGRILRCHGLHQRLGAAPESLVGQHLKDALPIEAAYPIMQTIAQVKAEGTQQSVEFLWTTDPLRHFEARVAIAANGHIIALLRDIHDRKNAQMELACNRQQLQESELRFRMMANHAPVLLWMTDAAAECTWFNERWLFYTGRRIEAELGVGWAEGVHQEDFQRCMHTFLDAFVQRRDFAMEYRLRNAEGEYRWVYDIGTPRFAADGQFLGYIGSCVDVTEFRAMLPYSASAPSKPTLSVVRLHPAGQPPFKNPGTDPSPQCDDMEEAASAI